MKVSLKTLNFIHQQKPAKLQGSHYQLCHYHLGTLTIFTVGTMFNFNCHLGDNQICDHHIWLNIILSVSVMVILDEINIYINRLSKAESESA